MEHQIRLTDATESVERLKLAVTAARREIINLGVLHGLTTTDLARITGLTLEAVRAIARSGPSDRSG